MVLCLVTLTDLQTRRAGLSASAELLVISTTPLHLVMLVASPALKPELEGYVDVHKNSIDVAKQKLQLLV